MVSLPLPAALDLAAARIALVIVPLNLDLLAANLAGFPDGVLLDLAPKRLVHLVVSGVAVVTVTVIIIVVAHMYAYQFTGLLVEIKNFFQKFQ